MGSDLLDANEATAVGRRRSMWLRGQFKPIYRTSSKAFCSPCRLLLAPHLAPSELVPDCFPERWLPSSGFLVERRSARGMGG